MEFLLKKEILAPIIIIFICFFLCILSKKFIYKLFAFKIKGINDRRKKTIVNLINNIVRIIISLLGFLTILEIYSIDTKSLVASLGVVGLVAGLALQDLLKDFIVGITIIFEGQYSIGDWVSINGFKGEVMSSNLKTTKIKAYTGEVKFISNRNIIEVTNYSLEDSNLIVDVGVAYESDIEKVKKVLDELCEKFKQEYKLQDLSCLGIQELADSSIKFRLVASTKYSEQFNLDRIIKKEIVKVFEKNNITIPYNQVVVHSGQRV